MDIDNIPELISKLRVFSDNVAKVGASLDEIAKAADAMRQIFLDNSQLTK